MSDPAWAKGFDLAFLKEVAALMRASIKPHCYGAFGLPKERDIADAAAADGLIWTRAGGERIEAAAIFRLLSRPSAHEDFAGRKAHLQAGDLLIRHMIGSADGMARLLNALGERAVPEAIWIEHHIEDRAAVEQFEAWGFELAMVKVMASSDLRGLWLRGDRSGREPEQLEPAQAAGLVILDRQFASGAERDEILFELEAFGDHWAQHYSGYNKRGSWTAFALAGFDQADPAFIIKPAEMSKAWKAENPERLAAECGPTPAAEHFPAALALADRIPGAKQRIRLMRLASGGGELTRHADITDPEAGVGDGQIARLHIPLISPADCAFSSWGLDGERRSQHLPPGALAYLDTRKPHAVINPGGADRIHLVIDTHCGPAIREMIEAAPDLG